MADRVPVILVTGFLGSGKTTFLHHLARAYPEWHLVFLVNEYADTSVDGETLAATGSPTQSVVGGSLFCECKAADFIRTMKEQVLAYHRDTPLDAVFIETSGTADPEAIGKLMSDHGLANDFELRSIVTIVAPARFKSLLANLPVVTSQLQSSNLIVVNKIDTVAEPLLLEVEASIQAVTPNARLTRADHCNIEFVLPRSLAEAPAGELSTCDANPFSTKELEWPADRSLREAKDWLNKLPETILRIKGRIQTPEGTWHVERTLDSLSVEETGEGPNRLVLIAHDDHEEDLEKALPPFFKQAEGPGAG